MQRDIYRLYSKSPKSTITESTDSKHGSIVCYKSSQTHDSWISLVASAVYRSISNGSETKPGFLNCHCSVIQFCCQYENLPNRYFTAIRNRKNFKGMAY